MTGAMRRRTAMGCMIMTGLLVLFLLLGSVLPAYARTPADEAATEDTVNVFTMKRWSPYAAGIAIGLLSWLTFLLSNHPLGISSAFAKTFGMIEKGIRGKQAVHKPYYRRFPPEIDWEWMLVVGVFCGAGLSANLSGNYKLDFLPETWIAAAGATPVTRWFTAFAGGIIMGIGARWAGGCTSGHGISGTLQLAVSSWIAAICIFVGGISTALIFFRLFLGY